MLTRALATANEQGAYLFSLRSTVDLCRLWQSTGKTEHARRQLSQTIAGFPEADRRAATDLLAQLNG